LMVITAALYAVLRNAATAWWILARSVMTATTTLAMAARHAQSMCAETDEFVLRGMRPATMVYAHILIHACGCVHMSVGVHNLRHDSCTCVT